MNFLGTQHYGVTHQRRNGKCYEISGFALASGEVVDRYSMLVHGSVHYLTDDKRVDHAWLKLPNGRIWEPISAKEMSETEFELAYSPRVREQYTQYDVIECVREFGHWGPWDEGSEAVQLAELWDDADL